MEGTIGEIRAFGGNFAPRSWAFCDGQLLAIASNSALFSLLGTTFGGDGRTTFALPDLRGRSIVHPGTGPGLAPIQLGQRGGVENVTLNVTQMPAHNHNVQGTNAIGTNTGPGTDFLAKTDGTAGQPRLYHNGPANVLMDPAMITNTGGGQPVSIRNPYLGVNIIICLFGVFPSRS